VNRLLPLREIGSEFDLAPPAETPAAPPFGWVQSADTRRLRSGRDGLRLLLRDLASQGRRRLVLPAYLCDSVEQAADGAGDWDVRYTPVSGDLTPLPGLLEAALADQPEATVFVQVEVFGTAYGAATGDVLAEAERRGVAVVEDRTHTLLSAARPSRDLAFASARKWLPLPDGGLATGSAAPVATPDQGFAGLRAGAMEAKHRYLLRGGDKDAFLQGITDGEHALDASRDVRAMSARSEALLASADLREIGARRRANHDVLRALIDRDSIRRVCRPLQAPLPAGAVPLGLPVVSPVRDALRRYLIHNQVYCPVHWPLPDAVFGGDFPGARGRNAELLTLVIDQRYDESDMERVAALLAPFGQQV